MSLDPLRREHPEFELVRRCARMHPSEHASDLLQPSLDWEQVLWQAEYHGVRPLLYGSLEQLNFKSVPDDALDRLRRQVHGISALSGFLINELARVVRRLREADIPVITLKGPVLAQKIYGDTALRSSVDLDILIRREDFEALVRVLQHDGYEPAKKLGKGVRRRLTLFLSQQLPLSRGRVFHVDVHTRIMPPGYNYPVSFDELYQRRQSVLVKEEKVYSLGDEDLVQVLCFHGAKNRWEALRHICDVAEVIRARPGLRWDEVFQRARDIRGERILALGLYLAERVLEAPLPAFASERVRQHAQIPEVGERIIRRLPLQHERGPIEMKERTRFHLSIQDTLVTKTKYLLYALMRHL